MLKLFWGNVTGPNDSLASGASSFHEQHRRRVERGRFDAFRDGTQIVAELAAARSTPHAANVSKIAEGADLIRQLALGHEGVALTETIRRLANATMRKIRNRNSVKHALVTDRAGNSLLKAEYVRFRCD
jgi:hypothetical protein